jgi:serine protease Do
MAAAGVLVLASFSGARAQENDWHVYRYAFQAPRPAPSPILIGPGGLAGANKSFLGVHVIEIDSAKAASLKLKDEVGVEITGIESDSPAEKAGLKVGDVVMEYQGQRVEGTEQFIRLVRETPVGRNVKLTVHRVGTSAPHSVTATIAARKAKVMADAGPPRIEIPRMEMWMPDVPRAFSGLRSARIGVEAEGLGGQLAEYFGVKEGVLVRSVMKGSAAEKGGLKAGDVITKVDQKPLDSPRDLSEMLREKKAVSMTVVREKKELTLSVTPEDDRADRPARAVVQDFRF